MTSVLTEIMKLPVADRADVFLALQQDTEVTKFLEDSQAFGKLFSIISERDAAFEKGDIGLTGMDELLSRLKKRRNAL
jgi:hypothetical protein